MHPSSETWSFCFFFLLDESQDFVCIDALKICNLCNMSVYIWKKIKWITPQPVLHVLFACRTLTTCYCQNHHSCHGDVIRVQLLEPAAHLPLAFFCLHFVARLETEREVLSLWKIQLYFRALTVKWCNFSSLYCCLYCRCSTVMDSQNKDGSRESYELKVLKISMCRKIAFLSSSSFPWFLWGVSQTPASVHDFSLTIAKSKWS